MTLALHKQCLITCQSTTFTSVSHPTVVFVLVLNVLFTALLYVHRCYFATALNDHPADPMRSQYAPSFLAGYRSATALLNTIREQFNLFPAQITRFWVIWTHAFSACVSVRFARSAATPLSSADQGVRSCSAP